MDGIEFYSEGFAPDSKIFAEELEIEERNGWSQEESGYPDTFQCEGEKADCESLRGLVEPEMTEDGIIDSLTRAHIRKPVETPAPDQPPFSMVEIVGSTFSRREPSCVKAEASLQE